MFHNQRHILQLSLVEIVIIGVVFRMIFVVIFNPKPRDQLSICPARLAAGLRWALAQDFLALQARSPRARCIIVVSLSTRRLCMRLALMWNCTSMPL